MAGPAADSATTRAVLLAPLRMASPGWGSRALAARVGTSQSAVARAWAQAYEPSLEVPFVGHDLRLLAVELVGGATVLVLSGRPAPAPPVRGFMRSPRRRPWQTLLAADLADGAAAALPEDSVDRLRAVVDSAPSGRRTFVVSRVPLDSLGSAEVTVVDEPAHWQRLLGPLVVTTTATPVADLVALQLRVMERARTGRARLSWSADDPRPADQVPAQSSGRPRPLSEEIAQQAFAHVLARVASGQLGAGDRVTEASLARGLRTSRGYVREALRSLAADGLVELEPQRGAVVPVPRASDVIDTYSARRALGTLLVERAATSARRDLEPAERALREMLALAESGDARATGDADLRFQDALAGATSMRHVPDMFRTLTSQVLLYTTVMGLSYVYSIPHMVRDDVAILQAVQRRDHERAVALWQEKIDAALAHMATRL